MSETGDVPVIVMRGAAGERYQTGQPTENDAGSGQATLELSFPQHGSSLALSMSLQTSSSAVLWNREQVRLIHVVRQAARGFRGDACL